MFPDFVDTFEHDIHDLFVREPLDRLPAGKAVRDTDARKKHTQVIVDLGDRGNGRARV